MWFVYPVSLLLFPLQAVDRDVDISNYDIDLQFLSALPVLESHHLWFCWLFHIFPGCFLTGLTLVLSAASLFGNGLCSTVYFI